MHSHARNSNRIFFFRMYFLFLTQTRMQYSAARKPIKFACRENKLLLFSRDDQSTVNRLHLPHLSLFLRAEKQQFRRSLNDNKGTTNGPDPFISSSREKIYFRRWRERREISEACEAQFTSEFHVFPKGTKSQKLRSANSKSHSCRTYYFTPFNRSMLYFS